MYVPKHFSQDDRTALDDMMRDNPFGILFGNLDAAPFATHLPFLLDGDRLLGHFSRGNPHWKAVDGKTEMLAVFAGPHAYVSPRWYGSAQAVPTWNYAAVHVYGVPQVTEDPTAIREMLDRLVAEYEGDAWSLAGQDEDFLDRMTCGIVAFELPIARIEGKFKLSQNRPAEDRSRVAAELEVSPDSAARALAGLMRQYAEGE